MFDVPVNISAVLGKAQMSRGPAPQADGQGSVLELDRKVGEAIDVYVNNRLVARGEVVVVDERLGVTMTEIIKDGDAGAVTRALLTPLAKPLFLEGPDPCGYWWSDG